MTTKLAEIPIIEDIYDFDSITLREATEKVQHTQAFIEKLEIKEQHHLLWLKKAKRYLELALNEIEERKAVENFGNFCIENGGDNDQSSAQLSYHGQTSSNGLSSDNGNSSGADHNYNSNSKKNNNYQAQKEQQTQQQPYGNVDQWIKLHEMLSSSAAGAQSQVSQTSSQTMGVPKYLNPVGINSQQYAVADRIEEEEEGIDGEKDDNYSQTSSIRNHHHNQSDSGKDICNESTISGKSHGSAASSQLKYLAHQNRLKSKTKQDMMQEFIKQTLDKTRITANEIPTPFYSTGPRSNFSSDDGVSLKKKKSFDSAAPQQANKKPRARASLDRPLEPESSSGSEYSNVQSRIKQDLEQQRLKKLETPYFTTGKASYPKYKPPVEKKINPEEEKKKKTKNFLKRSTASVILPPLLSKPPLPKNQDSKISKEEVSKQNNSLRRQSTDQLLSQNGSTQQESNDRTNTNNVLSPNKIILEPLERNRSNTTQSEGDQSNTDNSKIQREISEASQADESDGYEDKEKDQTMKSQNSNAENTFQREKINSEKTSSAVSKVSHSARGTQEREEEQKEDSDEDDTEEQIEENNHQEIIDSSGFQQTHKTNPGEEMKKGVVKSTQVIGQSQKEEQMHLEKSASDNIILRQASLELETKGELTKQDVSLQKQQIEKSNLMNKLEELNMKKQEEDNELNSQETSDNRTRDDKIKLTWQEREKDENPSDSDDDQVAIAGNAEIRDSKEILDGNNIQGDIGNQEDKQIQEEIEENNVGISNSSSNSSSRRIIEPTEIGQNNKKRDSGDFGHTDLLRQKMARLMEGLSSIDKEGENDEDMDDLENEEQQQTEIKQENSKSVLKQAENTTLNNSKPPLKKKTEIFGRPRAARTSVSSSNTSLTAPSNSSASTDVGATAAPSDKKKQFRNTDNKSKIDIADDRSSTSKIEQTNNKTKETQQIDEEAAIQQNQDNTKTKKKTTGVKSSASSAAQNQACSQQSKLLTKMLKELGEDNQLIDYSPHIPTFNHLFSGFYNAIWTASNPMMGGNLASTATLNTNFCLIDHMRDIYSLFAQHVERVDNADKALLRYKAVVTPLEVLPSEVYYVNDPTKVAVYQNRVDIDIRKFIERQIIFTQRMNGENFAGHLLPHEEFYFRVVKSKPEVYDIISRSFMRKRDWFELPHGLQLRTSWNLLWTWSKPQIDFNKLLLFQKVNHFPFNKNLVRKDLLKKNFERITKLGPKAAQAFNILPLTFVLPKEYCNFSERFYEDILKEGEDNIWIMKPVGKSQGRGISLVNDISQVVYAEPVVVQKYMKDPLLLEGYKFDMRIYALVTHMKPLEAFVYKEGFARLSTEKYTLNSDNIRNNQIHLTNFSIQKHHYDYSSGANFIGGTKISLRMLQEKLHTRGISWEKIWTQVQEIIVKSLLACQADIPSNPNCFEIFGYDIIIDSSLKCVLLEINSSPSLARDFIIDDLIKQQMVDDALDLIQPLQFDRLRLLEVFDRRIREEQGNKSNINTTNNSKLQLNRDLNYILRGQKIRNFGEIPNFLGHWQPIAPTPMSDKYFKIIQSYKLPSVRQNTASAANNNNTID